MNSANVMQVTINGETTSVPDSVSIAELVGILDLKKERVAVELNRGIVSRKEWEEVLLKSGDKVEIVHFVGGG
ncbi:MAG TPA: sulfur carrier protein ThiS [Acidobacteriota bacterium]|jgi:thiamine biosynthesis protein ThiS